MSVTLIDPVVGDIIYEAYTPTRPLRVVEVLDLVYRCVTLKGEVKTLTRARSYATLQGLVEDHAKKIETLLLLIERAQAVPYVKPDDEIRFQALLNTDRI